DCRRLVEVRVETCSAAAGGKQRYGNQIVRIGAVDDEGEIVSGVVCALADDRIDSTGNAEPDRRSRLPGELRAGKNCGDCGSGVGNTGRLYLTAVRIILLLRMIALLALDAVAGHRARACAASRAGLNESACGKPR